MKRLKVAIQYLHMNKNKPYTYIIGWSKLNIWYYGCRYATNCDPNDLWNPYKTSSDYVTKFIKLHGDPDVVKVHKIFKYKKDALMLEERFLTWIDAAASDKWLNKHNGAKNFHTTKEGTQKRIAAFKKSIQDGKYVPKKIKRFGKNNPNFGKKWTPEQKHRMSEKKKGQILILSDSERVRRQEQARINGKKSAEKTKLRIWVTHKYTGETSRIFPHEFDQTTYVKGRNSYAYEQI